MIASSFILASLLAFACASPLVSDNLHVHERRDGVPAGFVQDGPAPDGYTFTMRLALVENNRAGLEQKLYAVSTPDSADYGKHLSKEEVEALISPAPESIAAVTAWLSSHGLSAQSVSPAGDWLSLNVTVKQANTLLGADYWTFTDQATGQQTVRTLEYSIPPALKGHLDFAHPTVAYVIGSPKVVKPFSNALPPPQQNVTSNAAPANCAQAFTPACLEALYGIPTARATQSSNRLAVSGFIGEYASQTDLRTFLEQLRRDLPATTTFSVEFVDGGKNDQSNPGIEANLDTQYTVGIASGVPTVFVSVGTSNPDGIDGFLDIVNALLNDSNTPHVFTTSYGFNEPGIPASIANKLCNAYAQLGARGTSVLFSSGDGGVSGSQNSQCTTFVPTFPSTCPFVTSVGGTQGVNPETAAGLSAGGFSNIFSQPTYQSAAVASYLTKLGATDSGRFNRTGRAYPDLAATAENVAIAYKGKFGLVAGTSCSAPITASIIALLNDQLIAARKSPLGFLNPLIYSRTTAFTDIVSGGNPGCGTNGFPATQGWDPVTGVGSPIFANLKKAVGL
ncbi:family S53 protease [Dentipellis sp. KUC8613]|nr:family S53 protease [Dentipellis sp. KUC8613]